MLKVTQARSIVLPKQQRSQSARGERKQFVNDLTDDQKRFFDAVGIQLPQRHKIVSIRSKCTELGPPRPRTAIMQEVKQANSTPGPAAYTPKPWINPYQGVISKASRPAMKTILPGVGDYQLTKEPKQLLNGGLYRAARFQPDEKRFQVQTGVRIGPGRYDTDVNKLSTHHGSRAIALSAKPRYIEKRDRRDEVGPGEHNKDKAEIYFDTRAAMIPTSYRFDSDLL